jgi:hypothetical protein
MKQLEVIALVAAGRAEFQWVPLAPGLEVMAWPARFAGTFLSVSARTASACATALTRADWIVSLTTPAVEDLIYERAVIRPEPVLLNPQRVNIASAAAIQEHSNKLAARFAGAPPDALVAAGKSWVLSNGLLNRPGRAGNYGMFSPSAPYASATGQHRLWQPLSFGHNLDHWDYSQLLRLVRRRPDTPLPSYDQPLRVFELVRRSDPPGALPATPIPAADDATPPPSPIAEGTLGERCLAWCLEEAVQHQQPGDERIAWYHAVAVRNGRPLGITSGNHCASAQSRALLECLLPGDSKPHEPRAAAIELQADAMRLGRWHPAAEVLSGKWLPRPGDLAVYDRSVADRPSTSWQRHVDRVIQVSPDATHYENIGANEAAGEWRREWTPFEHPRLLGFIDYPGVPVAAAQLASATQSLTWGDVG